MTRQTLYSALEATDVGNQVRCVDHDGFGPFTVGAAYIVRFDGDNKFITSDDGDPYYDTVSGFEPVVDQSLQGVTIDDLVAQPGDRVQCVGNAYGVCFDLGCEYVVETEDGRIGVRDRDGDLQTTSLSTFVVVQRAEEDPEEPVSLGETLADALRDDEQHTAVLNRPPRTLKVQLQEGVIPVENGGYLMVTEAGDPYGLLDVAFARGDRVPGAVTMDSSALRRAAQELELLADDLDGRDDDIL